MRLHRSREDDLVPIPASRVRDKNRCRLCAPVCRNRSHSRARDHAPHLRQRALVPVRAGGQAAHRRCRCRLGVQSASPRSPYARPRVSGPPAERFPVFAGHTRFGAHSLRCRARTNLSSPTHPQRSFVSSPIAREEDEYEIDEHAVRLIPLVPNPPSVARLPTAPYTTDRAPPRCVREALRQSPTTDATLVVRFRFRLRI
jgi:hypothetical protein